MLFNEYELICPLCFTTEREPFDIGDECLCGSHFISVEEVRIWKAVFDATGTLVACARHDRRRGRHRLAYLGAIGGCLIDRPEFDGFEQLLPAEEE